MLEELSDLVVDLQKGPLEEVLKEVEDQQGAENLKERLKKVELLGGV